MRCSESPRAPVEHDHRPGFYEVLPRFPAINPVDVTVGFESNCDLRTAQRPHA